MLERSESVPVKRSDGDVANMFPYTRCIQLAVVFGIVFADVFGVWRSRNVDELVIGNICDDMRRLKDLIRE